MKRIKVALGIVSQGDCVLIARRKADAPLGGFWEFPGGKCEADESPEACVTRELREELALVVRPVLALPPIEHDYPTFRVELHPFLCALISGTPQALACEQVVWAPVARLADYPFPPANAPLLATLANDLKRAGASASPDPDA